MNALLKACLTAITSTALAACSTVVEGEPVALPTGGSEYRVFKTLTADPPQERVHHIRDPRFSELDRVMETAAQDARDQWLRVTGKRLPVLAVLGDTLPESDRCPQPNEVATAWMCADGTLVYRQEELLDLSQRSASGLMSVVVYAAHEVAHLGQAAHGFGVGTSSPAEERNSDCSAGAYFRWLADRKSVRFHVTEEIARQAVRDAYPLDGTGIVSADYASEVVSAFERGFESGRLCTGS